MPFSVNDIVKVERLDRSDSIAEMGVYKVSPPVLVDAQTFSSGWQNYGLVRQLSCYKDEISKRITIDGIISSGTEGLIFTLEDGFKPFTGWNCTFLAPCSDGTSVGPSVIQILDTGDVSIGGLHGNVWVDLNVTFTGGK